MSRAPFSRPTPLFSPPLLTMPRLSSPRGTAWKGGAVRRQLPHPEDGAEAPAPLPGRWPSSKHCQACPGRTWARLAGTVASQPPAFPRASLPPKLLLGLTAHRKRARAGHAQPCTSQPHASERPGPGTPACSQGRVPRPSQHLPLSTGDAHGLPYRGFSLGSARSTSPPRALQGSHLRPSYGLAVLTAAHHHGGL